MNINRIRKIIRLAKANKEENKALKALKESLDAIPGITVTCETDDLGGPAEGPSKGGPYAIWITLKDTKTLNTFLWGGCHRWWNWDNDWKVTIDVGDPDRSEDKKIKLMLESIPKGEDAFDSTITFSEKLKEFKEEAKEHLVKKVKAKLSKEEFQFMGLYFDIDKGLKLSKSYKIEKANTRDFKSIVPEQTGKGIGLIKVDPEHAKDTDLSIPILIATLIFDGKEGGMLIDGHHRVYKALWLEKDSKIPAITLSFEDTMKIMDGPQKRKMMSEGRKLGLIKSKAKKVKK